MGSPPAGGERHSASRAAAGGWARGGGAGRVDGARGRATGPGGHARGNATGRGGGARDCATGRGGGARDCATPFYLIVRSSRATTSVRWLRIFEVCFRYLSSQATIKRPP